MTTADASGKQAEREMWATGDYDLIARTMFWPVGARSVEDAGVEAGDRVLDAACGSGNAAIRAAQAGGRVVGADLTPDLLDAARSNAEAAGVEVEWVEADCESLPFGDASFDVVLSTFGCMFAPDQARTARELARVLAPGGRLVVCSWTPQSSLAEMMRTMFSYLPPEGEAAPPPLWGVEPHVRGLFEGTGVELSFTTASVEFRHDSVEDALRLYETAWGPFMDARLKLSAAGSWEAYRSDMGAILEARNTATDGTLAYDGEYLVVTGRR